MKKKLLVLVVAAALFCMTACGSKSEEAERISSAPESEVELLTSEQDEVELLTSEQDEVERMTFDEPMVLADKSLLTITATGKFYAAEGCRDEEWSLDYGECVGYSITAENHSDTLIYFDPGNYIINGVEIDYESCCPELTRRRIEAGDKVDIDWIIPISEDMGLDIQGMDDLVSMESTIYLAYDKDPVDYLPSVPIMICEGEAPERDLSNLEISYYEEQPAMPKLDPFVGESNGNSKSLSDSGKYMMLCYRYDTKAYSVDEFLADYLACLENEGYTVEAFDEASMESKAHTMRDEVEIYHVMKGDQVMAVMTYSEDGHSLGMELLDAWEPGSRPDSDENKETAYSDYTFAAARNGADGFESYEFIYEGGKLKTVYVDTATTKGGYGEGCGVAVDHSPFYNMTVEEVMARLESEGYTIGEDVYTLYGELTNN